MQRGHAVDGVAAHAGQVRHAHIALAVLVDQRQSAQQGVITREGGAHFLQEGGVDFENDLQMPWQHRAEQRQRPALQRLGQQGVVGVGEGLAGDVPGFVPLQVLLVDEQAHQLGHRHRRMGVVELHRELFVEAAQGQALGAHDAQHVLQRGADEEVLLLEPQLLALQGFVVGVEDFGDVLQHRLAVDRAEVVAVVEAVEVEGFRRLGAPQPQGVGGVAAVAQDGRVVGNGVDHAIRHPAHMLAADAVGVALGVAAQRHLHRPLRAHQLPGVGVAQPAVGLFHLPAVDDLLLEDAVLIADAIAQRGNPQRGHRVDVAGGQPPQAAVAQPRLHLGGEQGVEVQPQFGHGLPRRRQDVEIDQVVAQVWPHQKLRRQIGHGARALLGVGRCSADPALQHAVAHHMGEREVVVGAGGQGRKLALHAEQIVEKRPFECVLAQTSAVFLRLVRLRRGLGGRLFAHSNSSALICRRRLQEPRPVWVPGTWRNSHPRPDAGLCERCRPWLYKPVNRLTRGK